MDLTVSFMNHLPEHIIAKYRFAEVRNATAVLRASNPQLFDEIVSVLDWFFVDFEDITVPGGNRGTIPIKLDGAFAHLGWLPVRINTEYRLYGVVKGGRQANREPLFDSAVSNEGFEVDNMKGRVAVDVEWNAKDGNLDRDLSAYRALYEVGLIDAAVIIVRDFAGILTLALDDLGDENAGRRLSSTTTTTIQKATPRLTRGDAGGCPVLVVAITRDTWDGSYEARGQ